MRTRGLGWALSTQPSSFCAVEMGYFPFCMLFNADDNEPINICYSPISCLKKRFSESQQ